MSSISGISSTSAVGNDDSTSTTTSNASEWSDEFHKILNGASSSSNSSNSKDSKTTIERTISRGADGSMIVTLTQVTIAANGSRSSKVISKTKTGGSIDNTSGQPNNDVLFTKAQSQGFMTKSDITSNLASNEYEKNSDIGFYITGMALKKEC